MANVELNGIQINIRFLDAAGVEVDIPAEKLATLATALFRDIGDDFLSELPTDGSIYSKQDTIADNQILNTFNKEVLGLHPEKETVPKCSSKYDELTSDDIPEIYPRYPNAPLVAKPFIWALQKMHILKPNIIIPGQLDTEELSETPTRPVTTNTEEFSGDIPDLGLTPDDFTRNLMGQMDDITNAFMNMQIRERKTTEKNEQITAEEPEKAADEFAADMVQPYTVEEDSSDGESDPLLSAFEKQDQ